MDGPHGVVLTWKIGVTRHPCVGLHSEMVATSMGECGFDHYVGAYVVAYP